MSLPNAKYEVDYAIFNDLTQSKKKPHRLTGLFLT